MLKIADNCHQLLTLNSAYCGVVHGSTTTSLLQRCSKLELLKLDADLDIQAYESLALYGGNLTGLIVDSPRYSSQASVTSSFPISFSVGSPIFDPCCKQRS
jgi:hypothetical protein